MSGLFVCQEVGLELNLFGHCSGTVRFVPQTEYGVLTFYIGQSRLEQEFGRITLKPMKY